MKWIPIDGSCCALQLCFWVRSDRWKRWTVVSRKRTAAMRAIYWQLGNVGRFTANGLTGSSWTQKTVNRAFKDLSIDMQLDWFSLKFDWVIFKWHGPALPVTLKEVCRVTCELRASWTTCAQGKLDVQFITGRCPLQGVAIPLAGPLNFTFHLFVGLFLEI